MRTFPVSSDGDIDLSGSGWAEGRESLRLRVRHRLEFLLGEWFQDSRRGTPYQPEVLGHSFHPSLTLQALNAAVREVEGVLGVSNSSIEVTDPERVMSYEVTVRDEFGSSDVSLEVRV